MVRLSAMTRSSSSRRKSALPSLPPHHIPRVRLTSELSKGLDPAFALTTVVAPAGYGKTVLVADYVSHSPVPAAWVSLSEAIHDLQDFFLALEEAIARTFPGFGSPLAALVATSPRPDTVIDSAVGHLAETLARLAPGGMLLVLDNFDALGPATYGPQVVAAMIDLLAENMQMLIASRQPLAELDPLLDLEGRILRLGVDHLRFTPEEVASLLARLGQEPDSRRVQEETEGWAAGIVAALHRDKTLAGDEDLLHRYLHQQVFARLSPDLQRSLATCAIPSQIEARLCREALGIENADRMLSELDRRVGFVSMVGMGLQGPMYRFHPLFRRFLLDRLTQLVEPSARTAFYRTVGNYLSPHQPLEGVRLLVEGGHTALAVEQVITQGNDLVTTHRRDLARHLLDLLPSEVRDSHAELLLLQGELDRQAGQLDASLLTFQKAGLLAAERQDLAREGLALAYQSAVLAVRRDPSNEAVAKRALELLPEDQFSGRAFAMNVLGGACLLADDPAEARRWFESALDNFRRSGDAAGQAKILHNLGMLHARLGELELAAARYQESIRLAIAAGLLPMPLTLGNLATILTYQRRLDEARAKAEEALSLARQLELPRDQVFALWTVANIDLLSGRHSLAQIAFERARDGARDLGDRATEAMAVGGLAEVARSEGDPRRALTLLEEAIALRSPDAGDPTLGDLVYPLISALADDRQFDRAKGLIAAAHPFLSARGSRQRLDELEHRRQQLIALEQTMTSAPVDGPAALAEEAAPSGLCVRLFGGFAASFAGDPIPTRLWRGKQTKLCLAYLLHHPEGATKAQLQDLFYADQDTVRTAIHMIISRLRQALEPHPHGTASRYVLLQGGRYVFNFEAEGFVDTLEFERLVARAKVETHDRRVATLRSAIALYRGPYLPELTETDWVEREAERLRVRCREAFELLFAELSHDPLELLDASERSLSLDMLHEEAHVAKLSALMAMGRRDAALRHYAQVEHVFEKELGLPPGEALQQLSRTLVAG